MFFMYFYIHILLKMFMHIQCKKQGLLSIALLYSMIRYQGIYLALFLG